MDLQFTFTAELWPWSSNPSMVFVSLPVDDAEHIREFVPARRGFGSVKVAVQIGDTAWRTSVFPDSSADTFVLPIKKAVRDAENLEVGGTTTVELSIEIS